MVTQSSTQRADPDVAYDADPNTGFPVYDTYNNATSAPWSQFGGTSDAAPQWAALIAIADQGRALAGLGSLDGPSQTLPQLYALPAGDFQATQRGCRGVEASGGGADEGISGERREIVHDYANHLPVISRERRYIAVASSGRFNRSSTLPMP